MMPIPSFTWHFLRVRHCSKLSYELTLKLWHFMILVFTDEKTKLPGRLHPLPGQIPHSRAKKQSPPPTGSGFLNMKLQHHLTQTETTSLFPLAEPGQWPVSGKIQKIHALSLQVDSGWSLILKLKVGHQS